MPLIQGKFLPFKITLYSVLFIILYLILPAYLIFKIGLLARVTLLIFYLVITAIAVCTVRGGFNRRYLLKYRIQEAEEKLNILKEDGRRLAQVNQALNYKNARYGHLKEIIEELNRNLDIGYVASVLTSITFSLIGNSGGTCLLYLVDKWTQKLSLCKSKRDDASGVVKAKEGSLVDLWIIKHSTPLLIEDLKSDFRFDLSRLQAEDERQVSSLIGSPLLSGNNLIGMLRLDSPSPRAYSQDDLRFLVTLCELGAVAIENASLFHETQELAIHDGLTSLFTKNYFLERLKDECYRGLRNNNAFAVFMVDIDFFKQYNDKFGHIAGDIVLKRIGLVMAESMKGHNPLVARFGGEEFCLIIPRLLRQEAFELAEQLRARIEKEKIILRRQETGVTVSIGVAAFPDDGTSEEELIQKSDKAMYTAKQRGRNRVCCI